MGVNLVGKGEQTVDIAEWLRGLGLGQYATAFAANAINWDVLPELTADDLKEIGVAAVGDRRRLLAAIAAHRDTAVPTAPVPLPDVPGVPERRQLSVMFCDVVGSTALATRLDLEDLRELIGAYHRVVAEVLTRFGGFVAKYMGDGVLAYFGYPHAHEDDPERAVRAGLAVIDAVNRLEAPQPLRVRLGIATGLAVVGDLIGSGAAEERGVVGETPNLAARLQGLAAPDTLVISEGMRQQIGALFAIEDLGPQQLAGFAEPQRAWRVVGESGVESRFEALRATSLTPLVGREEEIELLLRRWRQAKAGEGRVVLISGEAGIGKSRLTAALRDRLEGEDYIRLRYFASPHHQESALNPFIAQLERAALFERDDPVERKLDKFEALLAPASPSADDLGLLAELLSLPAASRYPLPPSTPQRKKEKTFTALLHQFEALARQKPVLMVFEDLHWIDPSSRELLDRTIERIASLPVLLVTTFRPEFAAPWSGLPQVTALTVARLDRRSGAAIVEGIAGNRALSTEVAAEIVERADGVPLFVEELTRAVLEAGDRGEGIEKTLAAAVSPSAAVPAALHAPLMARLDRLGQTAKEIAQIAAAIGREFSYELLALAAQRREADLQDALGRLGEAGLVFSRGAPPHATYLFKHALVRDAAYGSLLRRRREELHARIATALEADFADRIALEPELLARHLTDAGLLERAIPWWQRAGERATERSANLEAIAHLKRGIEILGRLPESRQRDEQELLLQAALMGPFMAKEGYASAALERTAKRAVELGGQIGAGSPAQFQAVLARVRLTNFGISRGELGTGRALHEETLSLAKDQRVPLLLSLAHYNGGYLHFCLGDLAAARRHYEDGLAVYDPERDPTEAARAGFDSRTLCHSYLGLVLLYQGYPDEALRHAEQAIVAGRAASHPLSEAAALSCAAILHQWRGEVMLCLERAEAALAVATEQVLPFHVARAMVLSGRALVKTGRAEEGLARLRAGLDAYRATDDKFNEPHWLALLAEACLTAGRIEEGRSAVREALAVIEETEIRYYEAETNRLEGELLLAAKEPDESGAEASFRKAIAMARALQAKSWELRTATSYARLMREQGRVSEARDLLAPVYAWFTEGFDTKDLKKAKALLEELA
jgi:class 3 adenylate cyclase/tetratricopeptide (TPR) repeat protein